ncbi:MAG: phenylalanyl-tRNA synthetase beta chain [Patescibacteria group bacterium]|nr:phenylalanyl-tRNA synthetase beta chain [Patescibacteria group bacterium]
MLEQKINDLENIVVGKILEIEKHPNADKLQLVKVDVGHSAILPSLPSTGERESKKGIIHIVCGAPNIEVGQKVPVALIGAKLPNGLEIKEAEIRGEKSFGMLCAEDELGLGNDHSGIMILDEKAEIGMEFAKYINSI